MTVTSSVQHCQCGNTRFTLKAKPLVRVLCHCTICQEFNDAAFGDVTIFLAKDVDIDDVNHIDFKTYKAPPAVQRGKCKTCHKPTVELFDVPFMPALTLIPSQQITDSDFLPAPTGIYGPPTCLIHCLLAIRLRQAPPGARAAC